MGHFLKTVNPEAVAEIERKPDPLPGVGDTVVYHARPGELRAGIGKHAAIVTRIHEEERLLDLVIIFDADDAIGQRRVPERTLDSGMGWERREERAADLAPLLARMDALETENRRLATALFGEHKATDESVYAILEDHEARLEGAEKSSRAAPTRTRHKTKAKPRSKPAASSPE